MGDGEYSARLGDFALRACESRVCLILVQGLLDRGDDVGFPLLSWESQQRADVPGGSCEAETPVRTRGDEASARGYSR